jgi:hypothetical protein
MEQKKNNEQKADAKSVSQPIAKPHVQAHTSREGQSTNIRHLCYSSNINLIMLKKMSYQRMLLAKINCIG